MTVNNEKSYELFSVRNQCNYENVMKYVFAYISNCSRLTELRFSSVKDKRSEKKYTLKEKLYILKQGNGSNPNLATGLIY